MSDTRNGSVLNDGYSATHLTQTCFFGQRNYTHLSDWHYGIERLREGDDISRFFGTAQLEWEWIMIMLKRMRRETCRGMRDAQRIMIPTSRTIQSLHL